MKSFTNAGFPLLPAEGWSGAQRPVWQGALQIRQPLDLILLFLLLPPLAHAVSVWDHACKRVPVQGVAGCLKCKVFL